MRYTETHRLEIEKSLNETTPAEGIKNLSFFGDCLEQLGLT
jgi:hypothetical protein